MGQVREAECDPAEVLEAAIDRFGWTFVEQNPQVCAPRGLLSTRAIRWAIGQLRREGATIQGLARQLGTTWNTRSATVH